jgi:hypothetical protein
MAVGRLAGVGMTGVINAALFLLSPIMGAVALPFSIGIAVTMLKGMVKIAGALYVLMFGVLFFFISPIVGLVALGFGGAAAIRIIVRR